MEDCGVHICRHKLIFLFIFIVAMCANVDTGKVSRSNPRTVNSFTHGISTAIVKCLAQTVCTPNTVNGVEIKRKNPKGEIYYSNHATPKTLKLDFH